MFWFVIDYLLITLVCISMIGFTGTTVMVVF
jgi:hypothetical protein